MLDEAINHKGFIIFCLRRAIANSRAINISKRDLDTYHGLLLEVSGDEDSAIRYYAQSKSDSPEAEFHYYRLMLDRDELPVGISLSLMKAAAYKGASVGQLFFGLDSIFHDAYTAKFWLQNASKELSQANLPWAASLICLGQLNEASSVLMRHAKSHPNSTLHFVRSMRARIEPTLLARQSLLYAFDGVEPSIPIVDVTQSPILAPRREYCPAIPAY